EEEQTRLREGLGWFGDLALAPEGGDPAARARAIAPAMRTLVGTFVLLLAGILALGLGTVLLVVMATLAAAGRLTSGLRADTGRGGIYAETFAAYMVLYVAIGLL